MGDVKLGEILSQSHGERRDAIHVGVAPVQAGERLRPSQRVKMRGGLAYPASPIERYTGVVDPFLFDEVAVGDNFWLLMAPGEVEKLRHEWEHEDLNETVIGIPTIGQPMATFWNEEPGGDDEDYDDGCGGCYS